MLESARKHYYSDWQIYLLPKQVRERYGITNVTLLKWIDEGRFPQPVPGHNFRRFRIRDLLEWEKMLDVEL